MDLTPHVAGRYGYLLKIVLRGQPGQALVRSLALTTWVQVAPASLPALAKGTNRMEYRTRRPLRPEDPRAGDSLRGRQARGNAEIPGGVRQPTTTPLARRTASTGRPWSRSRPPPGTKIAWLTAEGAFATHQRRGRPQHPQHHLLRRRQARGFPRDLPRRGPHRHGALALPTPIARSGSIARPSGSMCVTWAIRR